MAERIYKLDNLKGILIFLVVFAHAIEALPPGTGRFFYIVIYLFHMPLFVFCSGYLARYDGKRIMQKLLYPYLLFQLIHFLFNYFVLGIDKPLQFTTPYWTLWYILAMVAWTSLLPLVEAKETRHKLTVLIVCFTIGLLIGYDKTVSFYLSLSRIFVFFPFFLLGYYYRQWAPGGTATVFRRPPIKILSLFLVAAVIVICLIFYQEIEARWLSGARPYATAGYSPYHRLLIYVAAGIFLFFALCWTPESSGILAKIGARSLSIYLVHCFFLDYLELIGFYKLAYPLPLAFVVSLLITLLLSWRPVANAITRIAAWPGSWPSLAAKRKSS